MFMENECNGEDNDTKVFEKRKVSFNEKEEHENENQNVNLKSRFRSNKILAKL